MTPVDRQHLAECAASRINRRDLLHSAALAAAGFVLPGCAVQPDRAGRAADDSRPNVLMICLDDLNDWVGCLGGHPQARTPHIDQLAREGVLFRRAYCSSPLCGPSRAAFLSGVPAATSGLYDNKSDYQDHEVLRNVVNLPQFFAKQGYATLGAGKIFHGDFPEYWNDFLPRGPRMYQAGEPKRNGTDIPGIFDWGPLDISDEAMDDYRMAQYAVDQLQRQHDGPFFLACGIYLPHVPWYAPRQYFEQFPLDEIVMPVVKADDLDDVPRRGQQVSNPKYTAAVQAAGKQREAVQAYLACVSFVDGQVGRILAALDASPYGDNTIVVLFGDHGLHLGEKSKWHKDSLWAEAARAPLIVRLPGERGAGGVCDRCVSLLDLYPTLAGLCGATAPAHVQGQSLEALLADPQRAWTRPAITYRRAGQVSVRTDDWCYIRYDDGGEELYDYRVDEYEWHNLAGRAEYAAVKRELADYIGKEAY